MGLNFHLCAKFGMFHLDLHLFVFDSLPPVELNLLLFKTYDSSSLMSIGETKLHLWLRPRLVPGSL